MKITFKNVGAIEETELDLRPMTVIIGPNNSNKTYIAYLTYGVLQNCTDMGFILESKFKKHNENTYTCSLDENLLKEFSENINNRTRFFRIELTSFFQDTSRQIFQKTLIEITLSNKPEIK
jgi:predicted ATPase